MTADVPVHDFLFTETGKLAHKATYISQIRDCIADLPETKATFRVTEIDGIDAHRLEDVYFEFVGAWPVADIYDFSNQRGRRFVNPNYAHSHKYSDLIVLCECGAKLTRNYEDGGNSLRDEHEHEEGCKPYHRLRARAAMSEQREEYLRKLAAMGWTGTDIAPRLGMRPNTVGGICDRLGFTLQEARDEYRKRAANSYRYGVCELGRTSDTMAGIYGHEYTTLNNWARKHGTYEPDGVTFSRDEDGQYGWLEA